MIDIGLLHHRQELPGIGRKRFDVAALTLSVQGVKSQRRFSRTGQAGDYDEFVARYGEINVFQVVGASPLNDDLVHWITASRVKPVVIRIFHYESKVEMDFNLLDSAWLAREIRHLNEKPFKYPLNQIDGIDLDG